jgi:hypothetical protein
MAGNVRMRLFPHRFLCWKCRLSNIDNKMHLSFLCINLLTQVCVNILHYTIDRRALNSSFYSHPSHRADKKTSVLFFMIWRLSPSNIYNSFLLLRRSDLTVFKFYVIRESLWVDSFVINSKDIISSNYIIFYNSCS